MSLQNKELMLQALLKEIEERQDYLKNETIRTLYIGGGTPTVYEPNELKQLIDRVKSVYSCEIEELTVEANPDDLSERYLQQLKAAGVNRLSLGIQSFIERDLVFMNRRHNAQMALDVVPMAQAAGFSNISIDLIYGIPQQTDAEWQYNLDRAVGLNVQHISSYHLSIEPKTVFGNRLKRGLLHPVDDETSSRHYDMLEKTLHAKGFEHYEVSNFSLKGFYSKHNTSYWTYKNYIGVGPSAHSFDGGSRQWNIANNNKYLKALAENTPFWEKEVMDTSERYNEFILTSLRTAWGLEKTQLQHLFGNRLSDYFYQSAQPYLADGRLVDNGSFIAIPTNHFLLSDGIMSDLFYVED